MINPPNLSIIEDKPNVATEIKGLIVLEASLANPIDAAIMAMYEITDTVLSLEMVLDNASPISSE